MISSNHNNSKATQEIHLVCRKEGFPKKCFCVLCKMSDCGEAYLSAVGCEEDVFVDKETIVASSTSCWSLMSSLGTLTILCATRLLFLLTLFPFILRTDWPQITSAALTSLMVTSDPGTPPTLTIALQPAVEVYHTCYLLLAEQLHVILNCMDKSKLTHLLCVAHVQTARVYFKQQIRQAKCTAVDKECCVQLAIIGHQITLDKVLEANDIDDGFLAVPD
jgi:hypothetical protein